MKKENQTYPILVGNDAITGLGNTVYKADTRKQSLHHPRMKKAFIQLGKKFQLPDDIVERLYSILKQTLRMEEKSTQMASPNATIKIINTIMEIAES